MARVFNNAASSSNLTNKNGADVETEKPFLCKYLDEIQLFQNLNYGPFMIDSTFGSGDGRFMFLVRFYSITALDIESGKSWEFKNQQANHICGFVSTSNLHGILLYSPLQMAEFVFSRELFLAHVELDIETSIIKILDSVPFTLETLVKQMHLSVEGDRFVLLSERMSHPESTFYIYALNNIEQPIKQVKVNRINDKILFSNLIGDDIYFFDTPQVALFEDVFLKKSQIRRLCINSGMVSNVQTSRFPPCGNFIAYGNRPWCVNGTWCNQTLYLSVTLPYSDPEHHLFFSLDIGTQKWRQILIENMPSFRQSIIRPSRKEDRLYYLRDDRAALLINVVDDSKIFIFQPRNWEHTEIACFMASIENNPSKLQTLSRRVVLAQWPELGKMDQNQLTNINLPGTLFSSRRLF